MAKNNRIVKMGWFDRETLTVKFGGELSIPENIFIATAVKVPKYKYKIRERESLGNGWYGGMETNEYEEDNLYLIFHEGVCIGQMNPTWSDDKSQLQELNEYAEKYLKTLTQ